jgi:hypothetical protein
VQFLYNGGLAYVGLTDKTERGIHGIHNNAAESRVAQEAEAEAEDRVEVVADAEHGAQGKTDGTRGETGGKDRGMNPRET